MSDTTKQARRFRHTDGDPIEGLAAVTRVLRLPRQPSTTGLLYDLTFFSEGLGIIDRLAITLPVDAAAVRAWVEHLNAFPPDVADADATWGDEFRGLVHRHDDTLTPEVALAVFISEQRHAIQPTCKLNDPAWVCVDSGVNSWAMLWYRDGLLSYLAYARRPWPPTGAAEG
jgi:hypothetical protein